MSLSLSFTDNHLALNHQRLPSRFRHFSESNYVKLLTIGEGLFPNDRLHYNFSVSNSEVTLASESAQKIHGQNANSQDHPQSAKQKTVVTAKNSQVAILNDELLLYKSSHFAAFTQLNLDGSSTLFFADLINKGRSFENFSFSRYFNKLCVSIDGIDEYAERYDLSGDALKQRSAFYQRNHPQLSRPVVARIIIKPPTTIDAQQYLTHLYDQGIDEATLSVNKQLLIITLINDHEHEQKQTIERLWKDWRHHQQLPPFHLGKF